MYALVPNISVLVSILLQNRRDRHARRYIADISSRERIFPARGHDHNEVWRSYRSTRMAFPMVVWDALFSSGEEDFRIP